MIYKKKAFLEHIGRIRDDGKPDYAWLRMEIQRGNLIEDPEDGLIDTLIAKNAAFTNKWMREKQKKTLASQEASEETERKVKVDKIAEDAFALDLRKKVLENERIERNNTLLELKEAKLRGEIMPVELVKQIFAMHSQSILTTQKNVIEEMLLELSQTSGLSNSKISELRGKLIRILNQNVDKSIEISQKNIAKMIASFSVKKSVGERE
jgi:hypothetical protein